MDQYLERILNKNSWHEHIQHPCRKCMHVFSSESLLKSYAADCQGIREKAQLKEMPEDGENIFKFVNHHKHMCVLYIIYADFKALN